MIHCGDLAIDRERHLVTVRGTPVHVTFLEFRVLLALGLGGGRVQGYDDLARVLWEEPPALTRRRLTVLISRLRSKLGPGARYLDTVQRVGYRLLPR